MYNQILVPVDLSHIDALERALSTAADLARLYNAKVCYVSVATPAPNATAHNPAEFTKVMVPLFV